MSRIRELRDAANRAITEARSKLDAIPADASPEVRAEAEQQVDRALEEASRIETQIEREQRLTDIEGRFRNRVEDDERRAREQRRPVQTGISGEGGEGGAGQMTYREAFHAWAAAGGREERMSEEARTVLYAGASPIETRAQTAGTDSAGGYTVPTELAGFIDLAMIANGPMYDGNIVSEIVTNGGHSFEIPTIDDTTTAVVKTTEGGDLTDDGGSDITVGQKTLDAYMFDTEFVRVSPVLAQDSPFAWEQIVADLLGERLGRRANTELTVGDGSGDPNGIVTASSAGKTAAATGAVTADEILDLIHSVNAAYRASPKARIMFNDATLLALRKLKDGQGNYLFREGADFAGQLVIGAVRVNYSINPAMANMGASAKPIVYGDFGKYYVRKVRGITTGILRERFWPNTGIAAYMRLDGELANTAAVKHLVNAAS